MQNLLDAKTCVQQLIDSVGKNIVVATPLGLGKPTQFLNELYLQAKKDPQISLTIVTALSFLRPSISNSLAKRLYDPILDRIYGDYQDLYYEKDRRAKNLPSNVRVIEFFLQAGAYKGVASAQQDFVCSNYTHAVRDGLSFGINVFAQLITIEDQAYDRVSLSSNTDLGADLLERSQVKLVGEINRNLPYMYGNDAEMAWDRFDFIIDAKARKLFSIPKNPVSDQEFAIGLYVSTLIKDGGCLQIGIGALGDAVAYALILRHQHNDVYQELLKDFDLSIENSKAFKQGLNASTEMLVDGYLELYKAGVLKKPIPNEDEQVIALAGFFVGSNSFYKELRALPKAKRKLFSMRRLCSSP